ncbi:MAG: MFS transporter [Acidisphaera sp.]|nr:MFS transporter [Acidisphaera sp.]
MNATVVGQVTMSALVGYSLAPNKALSTLPYAIQMLGVMAASIPAGLVFARLGRKPGFMLGVAGAILGSLLFALAIWETSFWLYCLAAVPAGLGFGIAQHYRFAAAEVADPAARPRAIALVMTGGLLAGVLGPELVKRSKDLLPPLLFLGTYLMLVGPSIVCAVLLAFTRLPPAPPRTRSSVPIRAILARPTFVTAVIAALAGYGSMSLIMTSTPVQMMLCGFPVNDSIDVIRAHSIAMYAPGFVTGRLIQRFGMHRIICIGGALAILCAGLSWTGSSYLTFLTALVLLGFGWNFMFVGATTLLTTAHDMQERVRVQATNDFIVFGTVAFSALASGVVESQAGWLTLNMAILPPIMVAIGLVLWHRQEARPGLRPGPAGVSGP